MMTKALLFALGTCAVSGCVEPSPDLETAQQASEVPQDVIQRLNETGASYTGITYAQPPPIGDQPSPVVLTSRPFEGLPRQYEFPAVADAFDVRLANLPPGPYKSSLVTRVFRARDTSNPLAMLAVSADPPIGERLSFRIHGANFTVVGTSRESQLAFDVFDAEGRKVASYGAPSSRP